jgi:hypothetical protein
MWSIADAENNKSGRGNENSIQEKFRFGEGGSVTCNMMDRLNGTMTRLKFAAISLVTRCQLALNM